MVPALAMVSHMTARFRPLTGIVHPVHRSTPAQGRFRPLTGIVHGDDWYFLADAGFRPLMGMVLDCLILTH